MLVTATVVALVAALLGPGVSGTGATAAPPDPVGDRIPAATWHARQDAYLTWATSTPMNPGDPLSIMAHAERARRDPGYTWNPSLVTPATLDGYFSILYTFGDTGDFRINSLLDLLVGYGEELPDPARAAIEERILAFTYWWTEPTPPGIVDSQYYWTENHLAIFAADEYIAGQHLPDEVFTNSGMTGAEHMAHARPHIMRWLALRARFGFSEWLSNVYWTEDFMAMILLAKWADDPVIRGYASQLLDMMFVELASHLHVSESMNERG